MKNRFKISILFYSTIILLSCTNNDGKSYSGENYINFTKDYKTDSTLFSFAYGNETRGVAELEVEIASTIEKNDREYRVKFVPEESTAKEGIHFEKFNDNLIFRSGHYIDTLHVNVLNAPDLSTQEVLATFEIIRNSNFLPGLTKKQKSRLFITNKLSRPAWWNEWHEDNGLGIYTEKKFRLFIEFTGEYDLDYEKREDMDYSKMRSLVIRFKYHVKDNNIMEENGSPMVIAMRG